MYTILREFFNNTTNLISYNRNFRFSQINNYSQDVKVRVIFRPLRVDINYLQRKDIHKGASSSFQHIQLCSKFQND